jgi:hypothetical protein
MEFPDLPMFSRNQPCLLVNTIILRYQLAEEKRIRRYQDNHSSLLTREA